MRRTAVICFLLFLSGVAHAQGSAGRVLGTWVYDTHQKDSTVSTFEPARKFRKERKGYEFKADGVLIVRVNSFGCAVIDKRGKIHSFLDNVQGRWKMLAADRIQMNYETFMGNYEEEALLVDGQLRVISVRELPSTD